MVLSSNRHRESDVIDPLMLVRILRKVPHTYRFDNHLTDCAALTVVYDQTLTVRHVLRLDPLPPFIPERRPPLSVVH